MPSLPHFSDNPFQTRNQFQAAARTLINALRPFHSPGGACIKLALATGTHFDDVAAQLEGFARPLWAIGSLAHADTLSPDEAKETIEPFTRGLANGTDPNHAEYWGPVVLRDQRMVEMEIISFALLAAPQTLFHSQTERARTNITAWLKTINGKDFPTTNWLWFRVMTNLALVRVCGVPREEVLGAMQADLDLMEEFYRGEGWVADGMWSDEGRQADYYSGSFAIQFSQLVYVKMAGDLDPERCERFRSRAREFAMSFWRYFDTNGAAIPFGRSLTYRFALAGFWSAIAFADVSLPAPLDDWGVIKGLLLRHFRWWATKPDIFNSDGTLTIGFAYPNMYLSEDYNSPQSPYWSMKSFLALSLPSTHPFWTSEEKPLPRSEPYAIVPVKPPMHILCNNPNHHFLLSTGQFCPWPLKATEAKYGKYAYSSHFSFSVPTGPLLQQLAPDSILALSKDGGDTWRVPWKVQSPRFDTVDLLHNGEVAETVPALRSEWKPWVDAEIVVSTLLIAPCARWPDWYVRWHSIKNDGASNVQLRAVQGGFAIQGRGRRKGEVLPEFTSVSELKSAAVEQDQVSVPEGTVTDGDSTVICSDAGGSGVRMLRLQGEQQRPAIMRQWAQSLKPDANTNLVWQRTLIPTVGVDAVARCSAVDAGPVLFGCAVFALALTEHRAETYTQRLDLEKSWMDTPIVGVGNENTNSNEWYLRVE
ncbi:hypothetical protein GGP41_001805 [Bipolaris sorokiniana]|uniref:DUF2264 domain-containing protein n=1 Tax=Cochliobolus sativus TaxID=45130 RepID=A0A8H6DZ07_COCSA|nr:hypothetical protein GGP41_001805 [Bipolaris sorokiniana]